MDNITKALMGEFKPIQALIVYKWDENFYLETHEIEKGVMSAGKPLQQSTIDKMVQFFSTKTEMNSIISGVIPPYLLFCNWGIEKKILVWYNQPGERVMHFTKSLNIPDGPAMQPGLIYVYNDGALSIFTVKSDGRPILKNLLYAPPYHNCAANGSVCLGNAKVATPRTQTYQAYIDYAEKMFWGSEFSHLAATATPINGNVNIYWQEAIKNKTIFNNDILLPARPKMNLETLIKKLA